MLGKSLYTLYATEFTTSNPTPKIIPTTVEIDLTNSCNQDCIYCCSAVHRKNNPSKSKFDHYIKLLNELNKWTLPQSKGGLVSIVFVGGGEPTLFKGYEKIIKHAIDNGFLVSLITNGTRLDKLLDIGTEYIQKMQWIGVDIDSADTEVYNLVRMPKTGGQFDTVKENIKKIVNAGGNVDIKALVLKETANKHNILKLFQYTKETNARMLYIRSAILEKGSGDAFVIEEGLIQYINKLGEVLGVAFKANQRDAMDTRCYTKCHALYLLPVFSADGYIYLCCENRGNKELAIANWITDDWQEKWCSSKHAQIYNNFDISACPSCRPNSHNTSIQQVINNPLMLEELFF